MIVSPFETLMLLCFGFAWPVSIFKSLKSRRNEGKSLLFMCVVFSGYISGVIHKIFFSMDPVIVLYALNAVMIAIDITLFFRNKRLAEAAA